MMITVWAAAFAVLLIIELMTVGLTTVWFCAGSLVALILAIFDVNIWIQVAAFVVVSLGLLIFTRPLVKKMLKKDVPPMNTDRIIGQKCIVAEDVDGLTGNGCVKVAGIIWSAQAEEEDQVFPKGTKVIIKSVSGVKVTVALADENKEEK